MSDLFSSDGTLPRAQPDEPGPFLLEVDPDLTHSYPVAIDPYRVLRAELDALLGRQST